MGVHPEASRSRFVTARRSIDGCTCRAVHSLSGGALIASVFGGEPYLLGAIELANPREPGSQHLRRSHCPTMGGLPQRSVEYPTTKDEPIARCKLYNAVGSAVPRPGRGKAFSGANSAWLFISKCMDKSTVFPRIGNIQVSKDPADIGSP